MSKQLSDFTKGQIIAYLNEKFTYKMISEKLFIPISTIGKIIKKYKRTGSFTRLSGSGRKKILTKKEEMTLCNISENNPRKKAKDLKNDIFKITNKNISIRTVGNILNNHNIYARVAKKKPLLSHKNMIQRFHLSKIFLGFSNEHWKSVIFSDEASFELFPTKKHEIIYRKNGTAFLNKNLVPTVKFGGGKVMVWGCISYNGTGNLVFVDDKLDSGKYINLLANNLYASAEKMNLNTFIFQQDGAPCHTSKTTMKFFKDNKIVLLDWAAQSPDMNPIEHIWAYIKILLKDYSPKNKDELKKKITDIWNNLSIEHVQKLINSMPKRSYELFKSKGCHTKF